MHSKGQNGGITYDDNDDSVDVYDIENDGTCDYYDSDVGVNHDDEDDAYHRNIWPWVILMEPKWL